MKNKKFRAKPREGYHDEKKVELESGEVEVFECDNCEFEEEKEDEP